MNRTFSSVFRSRHVVFLSVLTLLVIEFHHAISQDAAALPKASSDAAVSVASSVDPSGATEPDVTKPDRKVIEEPAYTPLTPAQLQRKLSSIQYKVTQNEETEPAFRNKYWDNKKTGLYRCVVCGQSLFSSETKFKSGTGWPSFYDPIKPDHVGVKLDFKMIYPRHEVHCSRCKAHLGHVFNDGPQDKTGKRYCLNSAALEFEASDEQVQSE